MKKLTRRNFVKGSAGVAGSLATVGFLKSPLSEVVENKIKSANPQWGDRQVKGICPFCSCGCGIVCFLQGNELVRIEGDTEHPINHGASCPKMASLIQVHNSETRLKKVLHRSPGATVWTELDWGQALGMIADKIKYTRDSNWIELDDVGLTRRTEAIASIGGGNLTNEECYLLSKMLRSLGIVYIDSEISSGQSSADAAGIESLGIPGMTNHWNDFVNSDCILVLGSNPVENHPVSGIYLGLAQNNGAKMICVDPIFTRTAAKSDIYTSIRPGTDLAFVSGIINYVVNDIHSSPRRYNIEYITEYTDASYLLNPDFKGPADLNGLFSGFSKSTFSYDKASWKYQLDTKGNPKRDLSLTDPNSVFQVIKKNYARYTSGAISEITGISEDKFNQICSVFSQTGKAGLAGCIISGSGLTQQSAGTQIVRALLILQLLLSNIGIAGGGLNNLRAEANAQGAVDHGLLNTLPGYLELPLSDEYNFSDYFSRVIRTKNNPLSLNNGGIPEKLASLLRAWYPDLLTQQAYQLVPRQTEGSNYDWAKIIEGILSKQVKGLFDWGVNPAVSSPNLGKTFSALDKLEWLVVSDLWHSETANFWQRPGATPSNIQTEVFLLPSACLYEKEGSLTNGARWMQWQSKAVSAPGEAKAPLEILNLLMTELKSRYLYGGANSDAINRLNWDYGNTIEPDTILKEINGVSPETGKFLRSAADLSNDGGTACGNWLYIGSMTETENLSKRRDVRSDPYGINGYPYWAWSWPSNQRILHNRASVDIHGNPWDPEKTVIAWIQGTMIWKGDVPSNSSPPLSLDGAPPFDWAADGRAHLFAAGLSSGPLPEYYEPLNSVVTNLVSSTQNNPIAGSKTVNGNSSNYPLVGITIRIGEHWQAGQVTRNIPWLLEMVPEPYVEIGFDLAQERNITSGNLVAIRSVKGEIRLKALVTKRISALTIGGKNMYLICVPWHWGFMGTGRGDSANWLTELSTDPDSSASGHTAFFCDINRETVVP